MDPFILYLTYTAGAVFIVGTVGTLALYHFSFRSFVKSGLALKIILWIPLWIVYVVSAYHGLKIFMSILVVGFIAELFWKNKNVRILPRLVYSLCFISGIVLLTVFVDKSLDPHATGLVLLGACALSDIFAFFFGRLGHHSLPAFINSHKSWEGVFGQCVGGVIAGAYIHVFTSFEISYVLILSIGLGSACGDLTNSFFKRMAKIPAWSNFIPGHGGVGDRFASVAGTGFVLFLLTIITM